MVFFQLRSMDEYELGQILLHKKYLLLCGHPKHRAIPNEAEGSVLPLENTDPSTLLRSG